MNADRVNRWLSLAANAGVIGGMVLLAVEIRETRNAVVGATYQARALSLADEQNFLSDTEFVAPAVLAYGESGAESLSSTERLRLTYTSRAAYFRLDGTFYQYELGLLPEEYYEKVFANEMRLWVPRWVDLGMYEDMQQQGSVRPAFLEEMRKFTDAPLRR
jgi:hypothetical protein